MSGEIYGTVETVDGRRLTGPIRWDVNENFWDDRLDSVRIERVEGDDSEPYKLSLFGWKIFEVGGPEVRRGGDRFHRQDSRVGTQPHETTQERLKESDMAVELGRKKKKSTDTIV